MLAGCKSTHRDEEVRHAPFVLKPGVTVLGAAAVDITPRAVSNHAYKEDGVEPGEGALEASDQSPRHGEPGVGGVVNLACKTVPPVHEDSSLGRLDDSGVLHCLPGHLRESLPPNNLATLHSTEAVLLAVAAVPNPVPEKVGGIKRNQSPAVPAVLSRVVVGQEDGAMAVGKGHTGQVPEDKHESPLLVVHVPGGDDELFTFGAGVGVKVVSHDNESDLAGDVAVLLILTGSSTEGQDEKDVPGHANLEEHLEVQDAEHARVQLSAHEEIVDGVTGHAVLLTAPEAGEVCDEADNEATEDGNGEERTELVDGGVQGPDTREVETSETKQGEVQAGISVAEVGELLATLMRERLAVAGDTREEAVERALEDEVGPVPSPSLSVWESAGIDKGYELRAKLEQGLVLGRPGEAAIVVGGANPHVPHEDGEENHQGQCPQ